MNVIEVNNLVKKYNGITAVNDVSFAVQKGSIFGMLGPNGAGKSTTIECIIGLKKRDNGEVRILGLDPKLDNRKLYDMIGVQLQETSYQDKIKVYELCELFESMYENPLDYKSLLERFGLIEKSKSYVSQLSGGQRQKIAIILALISNPKIIFLDELTTGLDPKSRREMWECVKELRNEGRTIFMTTHYMEEAAYLCDQICIIDEGKIATIDTIDGVIEHADIDTLITFETKEDVMDLINEEISGISRIEKHNDTINIFSKREDLITDLVILMKDKRIKYKKINILRPGLEDAFLKLTGKTWKGEM
ncbi:ABC transporter ATP-binding protein [Clostridium sp. D2Q-11]|uniref:ABC transporter ATP-binding protein n=1 Tax=Anaeromonas frigoriresistens TaxID=2683708 RepID=A0A942UTB5_9FIRM|nr:ABC transporter ATP-binding protein [Anaeromonas frigoriresistens]MBS4537040.1 ABC transporter ATP-binding protein [Anaeromonas frigoriresistens]